MSLGKFRLLAIAVPALCTAAGAQALDGQAGLYPAATPLAERLAEFHSLMAGAAVALCALVTALVLIALIRFRETKHPEPRRSRQTGALVGCAALLPIGLMALIALPSFQIARIKAASDTPEIAIQAVGHRWHWTYAYPKEDGLQFDSSMLTDIAAREQDRPRHLAADNPLVVPVNKTVEITLASADVVHLWTVPALGISVAAEPGRLSRIRFKATKTGTYYGPCPGQCGEGNAYMAIEIRVVSQTAYAAWLADAKLRFAGGGEPRFAMVEQDY